MVVGMKRPAALVKTQEQETLSAKKAKIVNETVIKCPEPEDDDSGKAMSSCENDAEAHDEDSGKAMLSCENDDEAHDDDSGKAMSSCENDAEAHDEDSGK